MRRNGQSLIEVLVTISLLIFGVFTVLRVFPIGFRMLSQTASSGVAQSLAHDMANTVKDGVLQAPDGIVERVLDANGGWYIPADPAAAVYPCLPPDTVKVNIPNQNSLFMQRTVMGERITLKSGPLASNAGNLLLFGPVYFPSAAPGTMPGAAEIDHYMQVYDPNGYLWDGDTSGNPPTGALAARTFHVDANGILYLSPSDPDVSVPRHYLLSYRTAQGEDVVDEPATFSANQVASAMGQVFVQGVPVPGSVQVFRAFPSGDGANGTFALLDAFLGVIKVAPYQVSITNSLGYTSYAWIIPPNGVLAVDYAVRDWQILRLDRNVPPDGAIQLPLQNLDVLDRVYDPVARVVVAPLNAPSQSIPVGAISFPGAAPAGLPSVDVRDGIVYLDTTNPLMAVGQPVRVYYAAYSTFAQQPVVAYRSYTESPKVGNPPADGPPGYRFVQVSSTPVVDPLGNLLYLVSFPVSDIGKTVSLDFQYADSGGTTHFVYGQPLHLQGSPPANPTTCSATITLPAGSQGLVIDRAAGISFEARGIYLESGDVRRADDPTLTTSIWSPGQIGRMGEAVEDVYVARQ